MKKKFFLFVISSLLFCSFSFSYDPIENYVYKGEGVPKKISKKLNRLIESNVRINIPGYPTAFNPSIIEYEDGYLLTFRYSVSPSVFPWISEIGVVLLDNNFNINSPVSMLNPHCYSKKNINCQAEDARIFKYQGKLFLAYNDNMDEINPTPQKRRDMFIAEIVPNNDKFEIKEPTKLVYKEKMKSLWQKNWVPFIYQDSLYFGYSISPHETLEFNLKGDLLKKHKESTHSRWTLGHLRGGTPAILVDDEYLAFFHSSVTMRTKSSNYKRMLHYFMGAYTFSSKPPFNITKMTPGPIVNPEFYHSNHGHKRVIFPGGFVVNGDNIYIAYGKDDNQIWIAKVNKYKLKEVLLPIAN